MKERAFYEALMSKQVRIPESEPWEELEIYVGSIHAGQIGQVTGWHYCDVAKSGVALSVTFPDGTTEGFDGDIPKVVE